MMNHICSSVQQLHVAPFDDFPTLSDTNQISSTKARPGHTEWVNPESVGVHGILQLSVSRQTGFEEIDSLHAM